MGKLNVSSTELEQLLKPLSNGLAEFVGRSVQGDWVLALSDHAGRDVGILKSWSLDIELSPRVQEAQASATPQVAIQDRSTAGISSVLAFEQAGVLQELAVEVNIAHTYVADLRVELIAPSGARAILLDQTGGSRNNIDLQIDSVSHPTLMQTLIGQALQGNWILRVSDLEALDSGTLDRWSLRATYME